MKRSFLSHVFWINLLIFVPFTSGIWFLSQTELGHENVGTAAIILLSSILISVITRLSGHLIFKDSLAKLRESTDTVSLSGKSLVDASHKVSSASNEQGSAIQEIVSTVTELNTTIKKSVDNARRSFEVATSSQKVATEGENAVKEMIQAIDEINSSNNAIMAEIDRGNERIKEIVKVITEISQKTKVINDIVFQTKLLSFNASVEAAKAEEHGKGFAVVAEEIGNLARMSGTASKEIAEMLNTSILRVNSIVQETSNKVQDFVKIGKSKVDAGTVVARRCGEVLQQVVHNATEVNSMISEISLASKEQSQGMNEIASAIAELDTVTQRNADIIQDTAEYSTQISRQTGSLRNTLTKLEGSVLLFKSGFESGESGDEVKSPIRNIQKRKLRSIKEVEKENPIRPPSIKQAVGGEIPSEENPDFEDV